MRTALIILIRMIHVWTHTSIAWWIEKAFWRSAEVWWDTLQIFAKSPRGWKIPSYDEEQYQEWQQLRNQHEQVWWMLHSNYLANLAKPAGEVDREIDSIVDDFMHAHRLWYTTVNVHIGKMKDRSSLDEAMTNMTKNVEIILHRVREQWYDDVQFVFENTAGQGSEIGSKFSELSMLAWYLKDLPVGFTIDTAHCQGWWIDVWSRDEFVDQFWTAIGIKKLVAIHLNDSKAILGSKLDRHASLWHWFIGWKRLAKVIQRAAVNDRHCYIETPVPERRADEIAKVRSIAEWDTDWIDQEHDAVYATQFLKKFEQQANEARTWTSSSLFW